MRGIRTSTLLAIGASGLLAVACSDGGFKKSGQPEIAISSNASGSLDLQTTPRVSVNASATPADTLTIRNTGQAELRVRSLELTDQEPADAFGLEPREGSLPSEGDPVVLTSDDDGYQVNLNLQTDGSSAEATLRVRTNSTLDTDGNIDIDLRTQGQEPLLDAPTEVSFGAVSEGSTATESVQITNAGGADLRITGFALTGAPAFSFTPRPSGEGQTWGVPGESSEQVGRQLSEGIQLDEPIVVEPGGVRTAEVGFTPQGTQSATGALTLQWNDPSGGDGTQIQLTGNDETPTLQVDPGSIDFGGRKVGDPASVTVTVKSTGEVPVELKSIQFTQDSNVEAYSLNLGGLPGIDDGVGAIGSGSGVELDTGQTGTFEVIYLPQETSELDDSGTPVPDTATVEIETNEPTSKPHSVPVEGFGVEEACPKARIEIEEGEEVVPQTKLHLIGDQSHTISGEGQIDQYEWSVKSPAESDSTFVPSPTAKNPTYKVNAAGTYEFSLHVWNDDGVKSCQAATRTVVVQPDQAIHVELLWSTPGDPDETDEGPEAGSDMDLHFKHPLATGQDVDGDGQPDGWFDTPFDCFWFNPNPEWGSQQSDEDDPTLDRDDTDGAGPENINLNQPEEGKTYEVGVHYWNDHGFGVSTPTARVYINGQLEYEKVGCEMVQLDMWEVAEIDWPSGTVEPITAEQGDCRVIPNYIHPQFPISP